MDKKTKTKYIVIDLRNENGFRKGERLQRENWKIGSVGFSTIQIYKKGE